MPEVGVKMPLQIKNNNVVYTQSFVQSQKHTHKKKVIAHRDWQEFSLSVYFKTNETKKVFR